MRLSTSLPLSLLALQTAQAQDQAPIYEKFSSWFEQAKSYIPNAASNPIQATSSAIAAHEIHPLTSENWRSVLSHSKLAEAGIENWMLLITGGNKTCSGSCTPIEASFNETAVILAPTPNPPKLARLDCDASGILCTTWFTGPPAIWYIRLPIPAADQSAAETEIHVARLNTTTSTVQEMVDLHARKEYENKPLLQGALHPFDGWAAKTGLNVVMGYVLYGLNLVPSWSVMLVVSFATRTLM
ncbi:hypothetical protein MMC10_002575 [Thelotrema lepadinum]|nr:hypothetical protein [Thelotrema lepadinum]